jgi:hypothetical protein
MGMTPFAFSDSRARTGIAHGSSWGSEADQFGHDHFHDQPLAPAPELDLTAPSERMPDKGPALNERLTLLRNR